MKDIGFLTEAENEMYSAIDYYDNEAESLGDRFLDEIKLAFQKIQKNPQRWMILEDNIHKFILRKFPFNIFYKIDPDYIVIIAIAHQKRKPNYWKSRI
jgi:plasmid stabilization system protein ParE